MPPFPADDVPELTLHQPGWHHPGVHHITHTGKHLHIHTYPQDCVASAFSFCLNPPPTRQKNWPCHHDRRSQPHAVTPISFHSLCHSPSHFHSHHPLTLTPLTHSYSPQPLLLPPPTLTPLTHSYSTHSPSPRHPSRARTECPWVQSSSPHRACCQHSTGEQGAVFGDGQSAVGSRHCNDQPHQARLSLLLTFCWLVYL